MAKHIFITGSTDGIGKLAAAQFAEAGHRVYLHGRNVTKLNTVIEELKTRTNNDQISGFVADLSDLDAVRTLADQINNKVPQLDVLINNAGVFNSRQSTNKDGLDMRLVVNYLAPYLLTRLLLPLMEKADKARIINLSSAAQASVSHDLFTASGHWSERDAYAQSKLALTMWSMDLAKQLDSITVIPVNPGSLLNTKMVQEAFGRHWSSADKGANILFDLSLSGDYEGITGRYFDNDKGDPKGAFSQAHPDAYDDKKIEQLLVLTRQFLQV